jgi:hypothetical protein
LNTGSNDENVLYVRNMINALGFMYLGTGTDMGPGIIHGKPNTCSKSNNNK